MEEIKKCDEWSDFVSKEIVSLFEPYIKLVEAQDEYIKMCK